MILNHISYYIQTMSECELIHKCPFFNDKIAGEPDKIEAMKDKYCRKNNLNCARYMIVTALGKESVPVDLTPDEKTKAYGIISES